MELQTFIIIDASGMSKSNAIKSAVLVLIVGAATYFAIRQREERAVAVGDDAPEFSVPTLSSGSLDLKKYRGQVVVLNLWATWCPPCVEETPSLVRFAEKVQEHGVAVLSVSVDEDQKALQDFVGKYHITYPVGRDPLRALSARYGTYQFPETYILDRHGRVAEKVIGPSDWSDPRMESFVLNLAGASHQ